MAILGLILLLVGVVFGIPILTTVGVILLVAGGILMLLGAVGRPLGGRSHYY
ncbi:hypothetical protein [Nocardia aurantia]|uniref:Uncharacterized protein n=1 Tax=Nocardia aurantia TaxID=2585199 RepID=A0A7K0DJN5_9NOCA|nr:hypothetical protein [Nocardia aurantia]MQY25868.1 hypothetical protein [Nocardia aurantia]